MTRAQLVCTEGENGTMSYHCEVVRVHLNKVNKCSFIYKFLREDFLVCILYSAYNLKKENLKLE